MMIMAAESGNYNPRASTLFEMRSIYHLRKKALFVYGPLPKRVRSWKMMDCRNISSYRPQNITLKNTDTNDLNLIIPVHSTPK